MAVKERIVIEDEDRFGRLTVEREPVVLALIPVFEAVGAGRGEWEAARAVEVEYLRPTRRAA